MKTQIEKLYDLVQKIGSADTNTLLDELLEMNKSSWRKLFQTVTDEREFILVKEMAYTLQLAALYYLTRALEKQRQKDRVSSLAYHSYAAGINAVLVTSFLPVLRRYAPNYNSQAEVESFLKINAHIEGAINSATLRDIETISGIDREQTHQRVEKATQTMLSLTTQITPEVRNLAVSLGKKFVAGDFKQARRLYEYVRDEITYIHDPLGVEEIQPPETTIKLGGGDCDDKAVLLAALLISIGFETCLFVADVDNDKNPDHVYAGVYIPEAPELYKPFPKKQLRDGLDLHEWIPLDPTYEDSDFGVIPIVDVSILDYVPISMKENNH